MENRLIFFKIIVCLSFFIPTISNSQELYQELITNERDRRQIYQLNDWIGYINLRHITWITSDNIYVYFATDGGGIWRYHKIKEKWSYPFTVCNGLPDNHILYITYDREQNILIAVTPSDTAVFDYGQRIWLSVRRDGPLPYQIRIPDEDNRKNEDILLFHQGYSEQVGMLTFDNPDYSYLLGGKVQDNNLREFVISGFFKDDYNHIFFAIEGLGVAYGYATDADFHIFEGGLSEISPRDFYFTTDEIWIGGLGITQDIDGITRWSNSNQFRIYNDRFTPGLYSDQILCIAGNDSLIAFGTINGIALYNQLNDRWMSFTKADGLMGDEIYALTFDNEGLWIGSLRGLNLMELRHNRIFKIQAEVFRNQRIYDFTTHDSLQFLASSIGVFRKSLNSANWEPVDLNLPFPEIEITCIALQNEELWIAGEYGLAQYNLKTGKSNYFREVFRRVLPRYNDIVFYENGVFIGTDHGLLRYDKKNNKWQWYTIRDGLLSNQVLKLFVENGDLWMVTPSGLCQFRYRRVLH